MLKQRCLKTGFFALKVHIRRVSSRQTQSVYIPLPRQLVLCCSISGIFKDASPQLLPWRGTPVGWVVKESCAFVCCAMSLHSGWVCYEVSISVRHLISFLFVCLFFPEHYNYTSSNVNAGLPLNVAHSSLSTPCHGLQTSNPVISVVPSTNHPSGYGGHIDGGASEYYLPPNIRPNGAPALESPRIEITSYMGLHHNNNQFFHDEVEEAIPNAKRSPSTATLNLPNIEAYRDPSCLSPASSLSSRSCNSEASSYESNYSYPYTSPQTSPWQSPCVSPKTTDTEEGYQRSMVACTLLSSPRHSPSTSPRTSITEENWLGARNSRPPSPCNKRKYSLNGRQTSYSPHHSPTPSPQNSPRVSVTDETWLGNTNQYTSSAIVAAINALTTDSTIDMNDGIPIKSRKTAIDHTPSMTLKTEPAGEDHGTISPTADLSPEDFSSFQHIRKGNFCEQYLSVPQHPYQWAKPKSLSPTSYMR